MLRHKTTMLCQKILTVAYKLVFKRYSSVQSLVDLGLVSRHLLAIQEPFLTDSTLVREDIIMSLHMLFPIFFYRRFVRFTLVTSIYGVFVCGRMYLQIRFLHEPAIAVLGHAFMSFNSAVHYFMLIQLSLEAKSLPTYFTRDFFLLVFIQM